MQVQVLYFGVLKELLKRDGEPMELPAGASVGTLLDAVSVGGAEIWRSLAVAVNREYADATRTLHEGDEVALLPPVSGGSRGWTEMWVGRKERREEVYIPPIAKGEGAMDQAPGNLHQDKCRSFDYATHGKAMGSFAQDDTSLLHWKKGSDED